MTANRAAIYHFTNQSTKRPKIYLDQLEALKEYASSLGFKDADVYCDTSIRKYERTEYNKLLTRSDQYNALIVKDFYHISKNTMQCMKDLKEFRQNGVITYSIENGIFSFEDEPLIKPLYVATYLSHFAPESDLNDIVPVQNDIMKLFVEKKTNWIIIDQYIDKSVHQNDGEQINLRELIKNKKKYDLLLVHNLNDIHWRTANFCRVRETLQMDIYSLQDGFLKYRKEPTT